MTSTGRRCLMNTGFALLLLILVIPSDSASSQCQQLSSLIPVTENIANGSMIMKFNYTQANWTLLESMPPGYFTLEQGNTSFYIVTPKGLDYEELGKKAEDMYVKLRCKNTTLDLEFKVGIILIPINEFTPEFNQSVYTSNISENVRINDMVFNASIFAYDKDYDDSLTYDVQVSPVKIALDGIASGKFKMTDIKTGIIVVNDTLDYEEQKQYVIKLIAKDSAGKPTSARLIINIMDVDDNGPAFLPNPCTTKNPQCQIPVLYYAQIKAADKGEMSITPNAANAVDTENDHYVIRYSITEGSPTNIEKYFKIDPLKGVITKEGGELPKNVTSPITLYIKAEEQSKEKHSSIAILIVDILDRNSTVIVSTKSSDSISVGAIFTLLGVLLSAILVFSAFGLAFWIRQKKPTHQPLPGSKHYFTRPNLATKVFPIRDKRASESYAGSNTMVTTILRADSDETTTSDNPSSDQYLTRNLSPNGSVKCCLKDVADALENRQRPAPKSLRALALPIRSERPTKRGQLEEDFRRRSSKSEELFLERKSPNGSNFGTFRSSYSIASRGLRRVTNGTLETYVSEYPTLGCDSQSYPMSRNSPKRKDTEKSSLIGVNDGRSLPGSPLPFRDSEQSNSEQMHVKCQREDPNMPTDVAPPIPCVTDKTKRQTPNKPPRKFSNKESKQLTDSYDLQTRSHRIPKNTTERSDGGSECSIFVQGRQTSTLNKAAHIPDLSERARRSPISSTELSRRSVHGVNQPRSSLPRSASKRTRLTEKQITERACRSLEKKLHSLEKSRMLNAKHSPTLEQLPKRSERARHQTPPLPLHHLPKDPITDASSSTEERTDTHRFRFGDSAQQKRRLPPPLPTRKTNTTLVTNSRSTREVHSSEEDDPQYVNVKYLSLIGDSGTDLSNRLAEFSSSASLSRNHSQGDDDEDNVYLEPASMQHCLEADLNIRAKLELILASALKKKKESDTKKNDGDSKDAKTKEEEEETIPRNNSLGTEILPVAKFANTHSSSSSSSYSERDDLSSASGINGQSLENIFLGSADVVWPDPETTIAALRQHHLAMEDYTAVSLDRQKQGPRSPCNSITSNSSNTSHCHFGHVNSYGQFIVDIPCAESNIRVAKTATPMAIPFRDVETSMGVGMNGPAASGGQIQESIFRSCDDSTKENGFPKTISFDGIDQYEMVHRNMIDGPSTPPTQTSLDLTQMSSNVEEEAENCASKKQIVPKTNMKRDTRSNLIIDSLVNMLNIEGFMGASDSASNKPADKSSRYSRSRSVQSNGTSDSLSQDASIRSDCATVMSSELYEPSDSECETVRSLKVFDSIFDNEDSVTFSSAESDSQSVFRACHPIPSAPPGRPTPVCCPIQSPVCHPTSTGQVEKEMCTDEAGNDDDEGDRDAGEETDDITTQTGNNRTGSYSVSVGLPNGVDAVYKEPVLNAYKTVNEDGNILNEMGPHIKFQRTFVKMKKSKRVGRNTRHRLKVSNVK